MRGFTGQTSCIGGTQASHTALRCVGETANHSSCLKVYGREGCVLVAHFKQYLKSCTAAYKVKLPGQSTGRGCAVVLDLIKSYFDDDCDCDCGDGLTKFHNFL